MIPKIIHQTGPTDKTNWHPLWHKCQESWLKNFSNFEYKFWNDEDMDKFVKNYYSKYYKMFLEFNHYIMRVNFFRFCILHRYGGIYADLDTFCYENFYDTLFTDLMLNSNTTEEFGNNLFKVENSLIISNLNKKKYYEEVMDLCLLRHKQKNYDIEYVTGSIPMSDVLDRNFKKFSFLPDWEFNNLTGSYFEGMKVKHIRTSTWCSKLMKKMLVVNGLIINTHPTKELINFITEKKWSYYLIDYDKFNFYFDYSSDNFLTPFNKLKILNIVYTTKKELNKFLHNYSDSKIHYE